MYITNPIFMFLVFSVRSRSPAAKGKAKGTWTLSEEQEQIVVEWLQSHDFLWLRSTRDYTKKKAAWEQKAGELNISLEHLEKWWKNTKDWYVKVKKGKSGQGANRRLTNRDRWLMQNLAFYNSKYISWYLCSCLYQLSTMI